MRKILVITVVLAVAIAVFAFRLVCLALGSVLYVYMLPGLVARDRCHLKQRAIQVLCAVLGWAIVPWIIGLWIASRGPVHVPLFSDYVPSGAFDH